MAWPLITGDEWTKDRQTDGWMDGWLDGRFKDSSNTKQRKQKPGLTFVQTMTMLASLVTRGIFQMWFTNFPLHFALKH